MTRDLAALIGPDQKWLDTQGFLAKLGREPEGGRWAEGEVTGLKHQVPPL
jgi:hypothetical protein